MVKNHFSDATFAPEDPQLATQGQIPLKTFLIVYSIASIMILSSVFFLSIDDYSDIIHVLVSRQFLRDIIICLITLLNFITFIDNFYFPLRYWRALQQKRQLAFWQPENYLASDQPIPSLELPQPTRIATTTKLNTLFLLILLYSFILMVLICVSLPNLPLFNTLLISTGVALMVGILALITTYVQRRKPKWPYVEVRENDIAAALDKIREPLPWQNIRFFATYKGPSTLFTVGTNKYTRYYELATPQKIIRWRHQFKLSSWLETRPALDQDAYDHWHQQLLGYIKERTNLPLVDLDAVPMPTRKNKRNSYAQSANQ
ncbi:hypothetical protein [Dictyobacter kobayashii]|uniref:Uncharacterized protein n=1 Tax=Dictyobacter kobayashii TaxID=2014872 RepID=A0A402AYE7_9CHLR|nr:hypothetical protein [Dictyobacter kobayashii]GCE24142.1 hypothetical protein KDK_79420 [Dictyobacter kobayashii]